MKSGLSQLRILGWREPQVNPAPAGLDRSSHNSPFLRERVPLYLLSGKLFYWPIDSGPNRQQFGGGRQEMNPEEFSQMNAYEQVLHLSYYKLQGVGDQHDSDMVLSSIEIHIEGFNSETNPYDCNWE